MIELRSINCVLPRWPFQRWWFCIEETIEVSFVVVPLVMLTIDFLEKEVTFMSILMPWRKRLTRNMWSSASHVRNNTITLAICLAREILDLDGCIRTLKDETLGRGCGGILNIYIGINLGIERKLTWKGKKSIYDPQNLQFKTIRHNGKLSKRIHQ